MGARKIILTLAAAAVALPVGFAAASPNLTASTPAGPCCLTLHASTFVGTYHACSGCENDTTVANNGVCVDGADSPITAVCEVIWHGGNPKTLCTPSPTTPWYGNDNPPYAWNYIPDTANSRAQYNSAQLFAEGGGVVDDSVVIGATIIYIHIHVEGLCGNEDTAQGLADNITGRIGVGSIDLSKTYKFEGYINVL